MAQKKANNTIVTIDPGSNGSIVIFDQGKIYSARMPLKYNSEGKKPQLDVPKTFEYFKEMNEKHQNVFIFIEKVQSFIGDKESPGKSFGINKMLKNYTQILTIIQIIGFRFVEVPPITWQTTLNLKVKKPKGMKADKFKTFRKNLYKDYAVKCFKETRVTMFNSDALCLIQFAFVKMSEDIEWIRSRIQGGEPEQIKIKL